MDWVCLPCILADKKSQGPENMILLFNIADAPKFAKIQRTPGPADPLNLYCAPVDVFFLDFFGNLTNVFPKFL